MTKPLTSHQVSSNEGLQGRAKIPGDKSISHRSLMFSALAVGTSEVTGMLEGEDVLGTASALEAYGAKPERQGDGHWTIGGIGLTGFAEPDRIIDLGNSGTSARLLAGLVSTMPITSFFTGDGSLVKRPMARVTKPLEQMGAAFVCREGGRMPMAIIGARDPLPITYTLPVPSAQVKSAVLLAGLNTPGKTTVIEPEPTRDHTERMLASFGAQIDVSVDGDGRRHITVTGQPTLKANDITVPSDPSSAAFPMVAAAICTGSEVSVENVCLNPTRTGLMQCLQEMGAAMEIKNQRVAGGETVGDITVKAGPLKGISVPPERAASMIDEYPVLAIAASFANGTTEMRGIGELRVKESDRLAAVVAGLRANGVECEDGEDWLLVHGKGKVPGSVPGGGTVETHLDHRIAMAFAVMGMASEKPVTVDDQAPIATSFPTFIPLMGALGARFKG